MYHNNNNDNDNDNDTNDDNNGNVSAVTTVAVAVAAIDGNTTSIGCRSTVTVVVDDTARLFFQEQHDLVSEIFSFLDVQSLLLLCSCTTSTTNDKTVVPFSSILRYDHIIQSALSLFSSSSLSSSLSSPYTNRSAATKIIMQKLLQVFHINNNTDDNAMTTTTKFNCKFKLTPPSPLRLLRLVNGRRCEKCQCQLFPTVLATTTTTRHRNDKDKMCDSGTGTGTGSSHSGIILPSLSFGRFCCTQCIFENAIIPSQSPSQSQSSILRTLTPLRSSPAVQ